MRRSPLRKRLWLGAGGVALFITAVFAARALLRQPANPRPTVGLDFVAFYTAGAAVREGRTSDLYDLDATSRFQQTLAQGEEVAIGHRVAPWWNPPFYSLLFVPLSRAPFTQALVLWTLVSVVCAGLSCLLLCRIFPVETPWQSWSPLPVLLVLSTPFMATITHGQNTCTSLLILTVTVLLWRRRLPLAAGLAGGLLFYKPQLAFVVAGVMVIDLGWRGAAGYATTGVVLLAINLIMLPGSLSAFVHQVPLNLDVIQAQVGYPWERHATFKAFWRVLIQGPAEGSTHELVSTLAALCVTILGLLFVHAMLRVRSAGQISPATRDRLIAAAIATTPLLMPFYFDYDLLLLAIPAALLANEILRRSPAAPQPLLVRVFAILYVWLMVNPDVTEHFRINFAVPLLALVSILLVRRVASPLQATFELAPMSPTRHSTVPQ